MAKKVLVFGATGAMGFPLVEILSKNAEWEVYATSRKQRESSRIKWIQGDGHDFSWTKSLLTENCYDVVVDFLNYGTAAFRERYEFVLSHSAHFIFLSSARVYAENDDTIKEDAPRILDVCQDQAYLAKDSYDLAKARQEDLLNASRSNNYTIIRPSLTYNNDRLQFAIFEMKEWIYRVLDGNGIVFPKEMEHIYVTMTYGYDVANVLSKLLLNPSSYGETFNVNGGGDKTWGEILQIYKRAIETCTNRHIHVCKVDNVEKISKDLNRYYQYKYARGISRRFSNEKVESVVGPVDWTSIENGLSQCIRSFFENGAKTSFPSFRMIAYLDRLTRERTPLSRFHSLKQKIGYELCRLGLLH